HGRFSSLSSVSVGGCERLGDLLFILTAISESVRTYRVVLDRILQPRDIAVLVFAPHFPLAGIIAEADFVNHSDTIGHWADCFAYAAAAAGVHVGVVEALGG